MIYLPIAQAIDRVTTLMLAVRGPGDVTGLTASVRKTAETVIPGGFVSRVGTIEQRLDASLVRERMLSILATFFAGLALILACIGLYGVMAYAVVRRTREIGVRIAIGARPAAVLRLILAENLATALGGVAAGWLLGLGVGRVMASVFVDVPAFDPWTFGLVPTGFVLAALGATWTPARRAIAINPVTALRAE